MSLPQARLLPGGRLHLQHGPIDLMIGADAAPDARAVALNAAQARFATLLAELCTELPGLRAPAGAEAPVLHGPVASRMVQAVRPHAAAGFITPMAAVAGAVADEVLAAMRAAAPLSRAYVNNGGDVAFHLASGERFHAGLVDRPDRLSLFGAATLRGHDPVRGIATSGWRGRSFSFGIADAVTVLADTAAAADAPATVVANAVDLPGHPAIGRVPARAVQADSDLGERSVTRAVGPLLPSEAGLALERGLRVAERLRRAGLIAAAALHCQGATRVLAMPVQLEEAVHA